MDILRTLIVVSIVFPLAACDAQTALNPEITQEIAIARADPDAALVAKVEKALGTYSGSLPYGVAVKARDGRVELWGSVDSTSIRKRFELLAAGVVGVKAVENHIAVDPGA